MSVIDSSIEIYRNPLLYVLTASTAEVHRLCVLGFLMFIVVYMASIIDLFVTLSFLLGLKKMENNWLTPFNPGKYKVTCDNYKRLLELVYLGPDHTSRPMI